MVKGQELSWDDEKISLYKNNAKHTLMNAESIFEERWDELAQAQFWQKIMFGWTVENLGFWFRIGSVAQVKAEKGEGKE